MFLHCVIEHDCLCLSKCTTYIATCAKVCTVFSFSSIVYYTYCMYSMVCWCALVNYRYVYSQFMHKMSQEKAPAVQSCTYVRMHLEMYATSTHSTLVQQTTQQRLLVVVLGWSTASAWLTRKTRKMQYMIHTMQLKNHSLPGWHQLVKHYK